ncbi:hypothetical protein CDD81_7116 [Ophiocordyceps australis]|uniref:Granulins domain-containing protein n=1 Tax=Ophiocordyceps australis TaxID=1399860 RepID=A0A2C5X966_9HYPO|nr:hypothetical protein CDD81_7116 [Ophiocordyceps australis]
MFAMAPRASELLLPALLVSLLTVGGGCQQAGTATAMRKLSADAGEKILAEEVGFGEADDTGVQERALGQLEPRAACPGGMSSCAGEGAPNMCCQAGTYCTRLADAASRVACCPQGVRCGGAVGSCPRGAASCPASLGAGCCIPGYRCEGTSCVPSAATTTTTTVDLGRVPQTLTSTQTTTMRGTPSTVIVTLTVTHTSSATHTTTQIVTASSSAAATGSAPWRPTGEWSRPASQTGCPTGFYGCLATHGGGCCRTGRDCQTDSCPPPPGSKTVKSSGPTIVVPDEEPTATAPCADGWFLCAAGADSGCCPHGYHCGTASCHASQTSSVQKQPPASSAAVPLGLSLCWAAAAWAVGVWLLEPWA